MTILGRNPLNIPEQLNGYVILGFWNVKENTRPGQPALAIFVGKNEDQMPTRYVTSIVTAESLSFDEWINGRYFTCVAGENRLSRNNEKEAMKAVADLFRKHDPENLEYHWCLGQLF